MNLFARNSVTRMTLLRKLPGHSILNIIRTFWVNVCFILFSDPIVIDSDCDCSIVIVINRLIEFVIDQ